MLEETAALLNYLGSTQMTDFGSQLSFKVQ